MRLKLWFLFALATIVFAGVLMSTQPALAGAPVGFVVIFVPFYAAALFVDWLTAKANVPVLPTMVRACFVLVGWAIFMSMGAPIAALIALVGMVVGFSLITSSAKRKRIREEQALFAKAMTLQPSWERSPDIQAARGIPGVPWANHYRKS